MFGVSCKPCIGHIALQKFPAQTRWFIRNRRRSLTARRSGSQFMQPVAQIPAKLAD
jgi:hypothetical protein